MTSLLLLFLVTAMVQVLLLPSVVGAATGVFQDKAGDIDICKAKTCNDIKSKNTEKQKKICKENKEVRSSCPQTCDDVSVFKKECPSKITSSKFGQEKDCSKKYQHNRQCDYDYRYTGCTWDELQCTSQQGYTCDYESSTWNLATTMIEQCDDPPKDFPFDKECTPCSDVPVEGCPEKAPTHQEECSDFENGLTCEYNFMLTGCTPNGLLCSPTSYFTCEQDQLWQEWTDSPVRCPSDKCPTTTSSEFGMPCQPTYQDGLECKYGYVFTGCTEEALACLPEESYSCDYDDYVSSDWLLATVDRQECFSISIDLPLWQQCSWPEVLELPYEAAESIIRDSDTVGYLTDIVMLVDGGSYTEDYSFHRVRVFVKNNTDIVVAIPMVG